MSNMTKREYAVSLDLAKPGRGRMSPAAHKAIADKEAEGYEFALPAHVIAQQERTSNPKRKPRVDVSNSHVETTESHPHADISDWYKATFAFGNHVRNPEGKTMRVVSEFPDEKGYTHFIDEDGKRFKAIVNARWGTATGWPEKKGYVANNAA